MAVGTIIYAKMIEIALEKSVNYFLGLVGKDKTKLKRELKTGLTSHIKRAVSFSDRISIFKLPDSRKILEHSIQLNISNQDRRFSPINSNKTISEAEILDNLKNYLILGDVGAGKTTTLKRLVKKTFANLFSTEKEESIYSFPIVIKLGEVKTSETFLTHICGQLGVKYDVVEHVEFYTETKVKREEIYNDETESNEIVETEIEIEKKKITYEYKIGDYSIENAVGEYLNNLNCILFIDGLDEVHFSIREVVHNEIKQVSQILDNSKMIITSRYISEVSSFKQFDINEICALTDDQKKIFSLLWLSDSDLFLERLNKLPYADLADRPLFLNYLLLLFINNDDQLPAQSIDVYRQIVLLVIKEWDADKEVNIYRYSKYKTFNSYRKEEFLAELAFELTYNQNVKKTFTHKQLGQAYLNVYRRYPGLKMSDSKEVVRDIESHNGLVFEVYNNNFEFSHLSLQEYLTARFVVSIPFTRKHYELLRVFASPLAIANVISPRAADWFSMLFLESINEQRLSYQLREEDVFEFIDRIIVERIHFPKPKIELGLAVLYLKSKFCLSIKLADKICQFQKVKYVVESLELAIKFYSLKKKGKFYKFNVVSKLRSELPINILEKGEFRLPHYWN